MTSFLDSMVAETTGRKQTATLTPVGLERKPRIPDVPAVFLTNEAIIDIAKDLRQQAIVLNTVAAGLEDLAGHTEEPSKAHVVDAQKVREREADARVAAAQPVVDVLPPSDEAEAFKDRYTRLSKDAQDAAFSGNLVPAATEVFEDMIVAMDVPAPVTQPVTSGSVRKNWVCPTHGDHDIKETVSKKGREFRVCGLCSQFEK